MAYRAESPADGVLRVVCESVATVTRRAERERLLRVLMREYERVGGDTGHGKAQRQVLRRVMAEIQGVSWVGWQAPGR